MKGKVLRVVKGSDGVPRGVILLHKENRLERPIQAVCPLEINVWINSCCNHPPPGQYPGDLYFVYNLKPNSQPPGL